MLTFYTIKRVHAFKALLDPLYSNPYNIANHRVITIAEWFKKPEEKHDGMMENPTTVKVLIDNEQGPEYERRRFADI